MKDGKFFRVSLILFFIAFLTLYVSQATGYYDYQQYQKKELTAEKMKEFEADVKAGRNVDISEYIDNNKHNYNNGMSQFGLNLSNTIKNGVQRFMGGVFDFMGRLLGNND